MLIEWPANCRGRASAALMDEKRLARFSVVTDVERTRPHDYSLGTCPRGRHGMLTDGNTSLSQHSTVDKRGRETLPEGNLLFRIHV